jgi:hypothetical protein
VPKAAFMSKMTISREDISRTIDYGFAAEQRLKGLSVLSSESRQCWLQKDSPFVSSRIAMSGDKDDRQNAPQRFGRPN